MSENYIQIIGKDKLFPIVRSKNAQEAIDISKALVEGGIRVAISGVPSYRLRELAEKIALVVNK